MLKVKLKKIHFIHNHIYGNASLQTIIIKKRCLKL